jgi:hypothetical protein
LHRIAISVRQPPPTAKTTLRGIGAQANSRGTQVSFRIDEQISDS